MTAALDAATARTWLAVAVEKARAGLAERGIPIGAALVGPDGAVLGREIRVGRGLRSRL